jgi:hypothetical protein
MNDTEALPNWKPINQELLEENSNNGLVKSVTITEMANNEYVIDVEISWRTEPSRIMQNKDKSKPRIFKNLDRLKTYLQENKLNRVKINLVLKGN